MKWRAEDPALALTLSQRLLNFLSDSHVFTAASATQKRLFQLEVLVVFRNLDLQ